MARLKYPQTWEKIKNLEISTKALRFWLDSKIPD